MFELIFTLLLPVGLVLGGFSIGYVVEHRHLRSLARREVQLADIVMTDLKLPAAPEGVAEARMVSGQAVISTDYFKSLAAALRNLVGGEMRSMQTLLSRARREAVVRMLQEARELGASEVINVRFETSNVMSSNRQQKGAMCAEMYAYGTAIVRRPAHA